MRARPRRRRSRRGEEWSAPTRGFLLYKLGGSARVGRWEGELVTTKLSLGRILDPRHLWLTTLCRSTATTYIHTRTYDWEEGRWGKGRGGCHLHPSMDTYLHMYIRAAYILKYPCYAVDRPSDRDPGTQEVAACLSTDLFIPVCACARCVSARVWSIVGWTRSMGRCEPTYSYLHIYLPRMYPQVRTNLGSENGNGQLGRQTGMRSRLIHCSLIWSRRTHGTGWPRHGRSSVNQSLGHGVIPSPFSIHRGTFTS